MYLRTLLLPCYLQLLGLDVGERDCGDESADAAVTMLFAAVRGRCCGDESPCYLQPLGVDVGERDCGDESAAAAVTMLFAAVGGRCWGARLWRRICGRCCYHAIKRICGRCCYHAICSCWG